MFFLPDLQFFLNFCVALAWSIDNEFVVGLRLTGALGHFWDGGVYHREGRAWLTKVLAKSQTCGIDIARFRAKALNMAGI